MAIATIKLTLKVTQKYQATIFQTIREKLEIEKDDWLRSSRSASRYL